MSIQTRFRNANPSSRGTTQSPSIAEGRFGLISLHEPVGAAKATIVAVHGMGGDCRRTWTNTNSKFFWLKDGLEKDLPQFRVLTFGYDASALTTANTPTVSLIDHAATLHRLLQLHLETLSNPDPIIFIAHSIGGIVVKHVLVQSSSSSVSLVHDYTAAILFFGTPHRGSSLQSWEKSTMKTLSILQPNQKWYLTSTGPLRDLQNTNESWLHLAHKYQIFDFYETHQSNLGAVRMLIVTKEEATLNHPQEKIFPLEGSHINMTKFLNANNSSYLLLLGVLESIPSGFQVTHPVTRPPLPPSLRTGIDPLEEVKRIDFNGYVHLIEQGTLVKECSISDIQTMSPTSLLDSSNHKQGEENASLLLWVHIPLNQTSWVNPCLQSIAKDLNTDLLITEDKYWLSHERRSRQNLPHSRHFEPSCFLNDNATSSQFVIYLPYLHWDSFNCFMRRSEYLRNINSDKTATIMDGLRERTKAIYRAMRDDCDNKSLHPRRSLDQFFYSNLLETFPRDQDQVVSKNTKDSRGGKKMVMVDQLWLWLLQVPDPVAHGKSKTAIFTCFPRKDEEPQVGEEDLEAIADLRQAILDEVNSRDNAWVANGSNFVGLVVEQAVNVMLRVRNELSLDFLNVFRAAIGEATEKQTKYFRNFHKKLDSAFDDISDPEMKRDEVKLALEIADIIDELNSLNRVFEQQKDALDTAIEILPDSQCKSLKETLKNLVTKDIEGYKKQVKRMTDDARRTKDGLMDLLDLQQKEESLKEAHYSNQQADAAREQADETEAQSQILLLFTIVTIVFLPLSFFTSYYGMNVVELTGEKENTNQVAVWRVMGPISGAIIVGLLLAAFFMYQRTRKEQKARKERRKEKKRKKKQQSRGSGSMSSIQGSAHNSQTSLSGNPAVNMGVV